MERCGVQYRARSSFEKAHGKAPPRLQVIGFTVCNPKAEDKKEGMQEFMSASSASPHETHFLSFDNKSSPSLPKPACSPRSALQQLFLNQSLPSTSSPSAHHSLPPSPSSSSSGLPNPASSSPSTNHTSTSELLVQHAISPPAANQNWTSGISKPLSQSPSACRRSSGGLKSLLQSEDSSSDVLHRRRSRTSLLSSLGHSQCASSSSSRNQSSDQHDSKPSQIPIKENYDAFLRIKPTDDGINAKTHEINMNTAKEVINEIPHVDKRNRRTWLHYDEHPSAEKCPKSSWKEVRQITEHQFGSGKSRKSSWNEEKSKRSSLFMFVVSSPAPEFHDFRDFLGACHLCRRPLSHGKDVFMYSGDKAFCSMECRYQQIIIDERMERCPPIIRSGASQHTSITATTTAHHYPIMINKPHFINTAAAA